MLFRSINKVAESGIITLNLEDYLPKQEIIVFDIKDYLFMGLILKEKEFRQSLKGLDLSKYKEKIVSIICSIDAVIPMWAYMLIVSTINTVALDVIIGTSSEVTNKLQLKNIQNINTEDFRDKRVVIKGCGENPISEEAYLEITKKLLPVVKSIMYGEPCSTVPVFKKKSD